MNPVRFSNTFSEIRSSLLKRFLKILKKSGKSIGGTFFRKIKGYDLVALLNMFLSQSFTEIFLEISGMIL